MIKVKTDQIYKKGLIVEMDKKFYEVVSSRELIPFLGEPKGFVTVLKIIVKGK